MTTKLDMLVSAVYVYTISINSLIPYLGNPADSRKPKTKVSAQINAINNQQNNLSTCFPPANTLFVFVALSSAVTLLAVERVVSLVSS